MFCPTQSRTQLLFSRLHRLQRQNARYRVSAASNPGEQLLEWVKSSGGKVEGVTIKQSDGGTGYGLEATTAHSPGSVLVSLPPQCLLTYDDTNSSTNPALLAAIDKVPKELWGGKLALALLAERARQPDSLFDSYINCLPLGFPGLPMFFNGATIQALEYPPLVEQVKKRCRWLISFTKDVLQNENTELGDAFNHVAIDANALGWALAAVTSRAFRIRGPTKPAAMLPFIDMANHAFDNNIVNAKIIPGSDGVSLSMVATNTISPNEPITINYGALPNDFLLLDYGFIMPNNPYDKVDLRFDPGLIETAKTVAGVKAGTDVSMKNDDVMTAWQTKALKKLDIINSEVSLIWASSSGGPVDSKLLAGVRIMCASSESQLLIMGSKQQKMTLEAIGDWNTPLSTGNEIAALRTLTGVAAIALSQFSCTLEDDEQILQTRKIGNVDLSADMDLAVRFRIEKKRLLLAAISRITERIKELQATAVADNGKAKKKPAVNVTGKGFGSK